MKLLKNQSSCVTKTNIKIITNNTSTTSISPVYLSKYQKYNHSFKKLKELANSEKYFNKNLLPTLFTKQVSEFSKESLTPEEKINNRLIKALDSSITNSKNEVDISPIVYQEFLKKGMLGNVTQFNILNKFNKNYNASFISSMYNRLKVTDIYNTFSILKPELMLIQFRPDLILNDIMIKGDLLLKGEISEEEFFESLIQYPSVIHPCHQTLYDLGKKLMQSNIKLPENFKATVRELDKARVPEFKERVSFEVLSLLGVYAENQNDEFLRKAFYENEEIEEEIDIEELEKKFGTEMKKIMIADIPTVFQIHKISNTLSLYEIKNIFEKCYREYPKNPDYEPQTALSMAQHLYPEIFVKDSDRFIAQCLKYLVNRKELLKKKEIVEENTKKLKKKNDSNSDSKEASNEKTKIKLNKKSKRKIPLSNYKDSKFKIKSIEKMDLSSNQNSYIDDVYDNSKNNQTHINDDKEESSVTDSTKVMSVLSYGQSLSLPIYIENENKSISSVLSPGKRYKTLIYGHDTLDIVVDKLAHLFILYFGITNEIPHAYIENIIEKYVDEDIRMTKYNEKSELMSKALYLFDCLLVERKENAIKYITEGLESKEKEFVERIFNNRV